MVTKHQRNTVRQILSGIGPVVLHHGDCVGADAVAHRIARDLHHKIHGHPPIRSTYRANCTFDWEEEPKDYLVRNRDIVNATTLLIAIPDGYKETLRSGTWSTVRYAKSLKRRIMIVYPNGTVEVPDND